VASRDIAAAILAIVAKDRSIGLPVWVDRRRPPRAVGGSTDRTLYSTR